MKETRSDSENMSEAIVDVEAGAKPSEGMGDLHVSIIRRDDRFVLERDVRLRNNLMLIVGYLEFFNALDFPANVWQEIPVPKFAVGLMATGGTLALLASATAFWDFRRSIRNVRLLREERRYLKKEIQSLKGRKESTEYPEAWLSVNFRELGWELMDRLLMDGLVGFASILVGTGTIMAVGGANPRVFKASNLMSGYVGNGFVAAYGVANAFWSAYLWQRARRHKREVTEKVYDKEVVARARKVFYNHQLYALLNGVTLLVSSAGSLVSSTMWHGYVILIPCIFSSVYCNILWRRKVGYNRLLVPFRSYQPFGVVEQIRMSMVTQDQTRAEKVDDMINKLTRSALIEFVVKNEMLQDLCLHLANQNTTQRLFIEAEQKEATMDISTLEALDDDLLREAVCACYGEVGLYRVTDQERLCCELLGSLLTIQSKKKVVAEERSAPLSRATTDVEKQEEAPKSAQ